MFNYTIKTNDQGTIRQEWTTEDYNLTVLKFKDGEVRADIENYSDHVALTIDRNFEDKMFVAARICASPAMVPIQLAGHMRKVEHAADVAEAFQNILDAV